MKDRYRSKENVTVKVGGSDVSLIHPRDLAAYKKELDGEHQLVDIEAVEKYLIKNGL